MEGPGDEGSNPSTSTQTYLGDDVPTVATESPVIRPGVERHPF